MPRIHLQYRIFFCSIYEWLTFSPLNELGFDPILKMPDLDTFVEAVGKRKVPIKALLLDQSFSAGVGNWVAYILLYNLLLTI